MTPKTPPDGRARTHTQWRALAHRYETHTKHLASHLRALAREHDCRLYTLCTLHSDKYSVVCHGQLVRARCPGTICRKQHGGADAGGTPRKRAGLAGGLWKPQSVSLTVTSSVVSLGEAVGRFTAQFNWDQSFPVVVCTGLHHPVTSASSRAVALSDRQVMPGMLGKPSARQIVTTNVGASG